MIQARYFAQAGDASDNRQIVLVLLFTAIAVLVVHVLFWLAYFRVRYNSREWIARIFDPESYPSGSLWEAFGEAIRSRLSRVEQGPLIASPTGNYQLATQLACGDLCDVYRTHFTRAVATRGGDARVLKIPRVDGWDHLLEKEQLILRDLQRPILGDSYGAYFPVPIEAFRSEGRLVSAMKWREGFCTAGEIRRRYPSGVDSRHLAWMFNRILEALGRVHALGWVHGAILPPHLLFHTEDHGLQLIGWIHAVQVDMPLQIASREFQAWYPSQCHRREGATPSIDIHMAAKCIIWLAGGDPIDEHLPLHLPIEFGRFVRECLELSPSHRADAWSLHEQFRELLEELYGPPRFCHLPMS